MIVRTEEPIFGSAETTTSSESFSEEPGTTHDRDLLYGSGPETDDDLGEERRRAA